MLLGVDACGQLAAFESRPTGAAHSMDTDWYAVDRHGRVAQLWSGEEGAVPWDAHRQYWDELYTDLAVARIELLPAGAPGLILMLDPVIHAIEPRDVPYQWNGVLQFASRDYLDMFCNDTYNVDLRVLDVMPDAIAMKDVNKLAFDDYWAAGAIRGAYVLPRPVHPRAIGLYEYACGFSGPYRRKAVPGEPALLESLPAVLQAKLGALRMTNLSFHTTPDLDPDKHFRCHHYRT